MGLEPGGTNFPQSMDLIVFLTDRTMTKRLKRPFRDLKGVSTLMMNLVSLSSHG